MSSRSSYLGRIATAAFGIALGMQAANAGDVAPPVETRGDLAWVKQARTIVGLTAKGQLVEIRFDPPQVRTLSEPGLDPAGFAMSADGQVVRYSYFARGTGPGGPTHFVLDRRSGKASPVPASPNDFTLLLSPDGRRIAWTGGFLPASDLEVMQVGTGAIRKLPFPVAPRSGTADRYVNLHWAQDGSRLYVMFMNAEQQQRYYEVDPDSGKFTQIEGRLSARPLEPHAYVKGGSEVALHRPPPPRSHWSEGSKLRARHGGVEVAFEDPVLLMRVAGGTGREIDRAATRGGRHMLPLQISGWLEDGRYLVYSNSQTGATYLVGIREAARAALPALKYFDWR